MMFDPLYLCRYTHLIIFWFVMVKKEEKQYNIIKIINYFMFNYLLFFFMYQINYQLQVYSIYGHFYPITKH